MLPISITLRGIASHEETTVDWSALHSPVGICAPYGTGKTALIEGALFSLYGRPAWYDTGTIYDFMTQGGNGDASVSLTFEHGGLRYRAERVLRDTGKTKSQKATLSALSLDEQESRILAGPKVRDFDAYVSAHFGTYDDALATWFLAQNRAGDLCGQPGENDLVQRRRACIDGFVGTDALDAKEERLAKCQNREAGALDELDRQIAAEELGSTIDAKAAVASAQSDKFAAEETLSIAENSLESLRKSLRDAEGGDDVLRVQIEECDRAEADARELNDALASTQTKLAEAVARSNRESDEAANVQKLDGLRSQRADLQREQAAFNAWKVWELTAKDLRHDLKNKQQIVLSAEQFASVDDETRDLAKRLEPLRAELAQVREKNTQAGATNAERAAERSRLSSKVASLKGQIQSLEDRLEKKPDVPFGEKCAPCPLMVEWSKIPVDIDALREQLAENEAALEAYPDDAELIDTTDIITRGEKARAASDAVEKADRWRSDIDAAKAAADAIQARIDEHAKAEPEHPADPSERLQAVQVEIDALAGAPERLEACKEASKRAKELRTELASIDERLKAVEASLPELRTKAEHAREALADREAKRANLRAAVTEQETLVRENRQAAESGVRQVARAEERLEALERRHEERRQRIQRARAMRDVQESLTRLRYTYGKKGFRQQVIDDGVIELEAIADQLFDVATGGKFRLRIATQILNGDGTVREDFRIMVRDARGERDVLQYSGGQLQLIQIVFRIAVALWVGKLRGVQPECLFLDEAFDRLGEDGTEALLNVLDSLADRIKLIVVVTHDRSIADRLPGRVFLERRAFGVDVRTSAELAVA